MTHDEILELFEKNGVLIKGHFILTSGRHSSTYLQCASLLQYPTATEKAVKELAKKLEGIEVETVVGPAMGGILLSYEIARTLGARAIFTERVDGEMALRRGFKVNPGEKVLVAEDVVTTGGSVKEVIAVMKSLGADVVAVAGLVDRSGSNVAFGVPAHFLVSITAESYAPDQCPLCKKGVPAEKPGSRIFCER
ncbi:MAG: orotate phosphoribosyltransferase [Tepidanaerobacteraceae bacterium]|jgi:orotate phosphoribosyltransferase